MEPLPSSRATWHWLSRCITRALPLPPLQEAENATPLLIASHSTPSIHSKGLGLGLGLTTLEHPSVNKFTSSQTINRYARYHNAVMATTRQSGRPAARHNVGFHLTGMPSHSGPRWVPLICPAIVSTGYNTTHVQENARSHKRQRSKQTQNKNASIL